MNGKLVRTELIETASVEWLKAQRQFGFKDELRESFVTAFILGAGHGYELATLHFAKIMKGPTCDES